MEQSALNSRFARFPFSLIVTVLVFSLAIFGAAQIGFFVESINRWTSLELEKLALYSGIICAVFFLSIYAGSTLSWFFSQF